MRFWKKQKLFLFLNPKKHLKQLLDDIKLKIIPTKTEFIVLESVFIEDFRVKAHTIRGGAGFFHLKEVVLISEEIEEYFKKISGGKTQGKEKLI